MNIQILDLLSYTILILIVLRLTENMDNRGRCVIVSVFTIIYSFIFYFYDVEAIILTILDFLT